jgi:hypothetical protein
MLEGESSFDNEYYRIAFINTVDAEVTHLQGS